MPAAVPPYRAAGRLPGRSAALYDTRVALVLAILVAVAAGGCGRAGDAGRSVPRAARALATEAPDTTAPPGGTATAVPSGPTLAGPTLAGPTPSGPTLVSPTPAGPTLVSPTPAGPVASGVLPSRSPATGPSRSGTPPVGPARSVLPEPAGRTGSAGNSANSANSATGGATARESATARGSAAASSGAGTAAPSPTAPRPDARAATTVDWLNIDLAVPANSTGCAAGIVRFRAGVASVGGTRYRLGHWIAGRQVDAPARYADVTGDGVVDAVLALDCATVPGWAANPPALLLVVDHAGARSLPPVVSVPARGFDANGAATLGDVTAGYRTVRWHSQTWEGTGGATFEARWTGDGFTVTATP